MTEVLAQRFDANVVDAKGQTPLHAIVRVRAGISLKDKNAVIRALLDAGADVNARDQTGTNAFCAALPEPEVLATLLERGLDPNMAPSNGGNCWAGLQSYLSPTAIIRVAERVPNLQTPHRPDGTPGAGPLFSFAQNTELELVKYFLSRGLRPIDRGYNGYSVMHAALGSSGGSGNHAVNREVIIGLLLDAGANINERSDYGDTPLMAAIRQPASLIQLAVKRGADVNAVDPRTGESVLDRFVRAHNDEAVAVLRAAGARAASEIRLPAQ